MIELRVAKVKHGVTTLGRALWMTKHVYRCTCQQVGQKADQKTHPERQRKILRKGTGCCCQIVIKQYLLLRTQQRCSVARLELLPQH